MPQPLHDHVLNAHDFAVVGARRGGLLRPDRHHLVEDGRGGCKVRQRVEGKCAWGITGETGGRATRERERYGGQRQGVFCSNTGERYGSVARQEWCRGRCMAQRGRGVGRLGRQTRSGNWVYGTLAFDGARPRVAVFSSAIAVGAAALGGLRSGRGN